MRTSSLPLLLLFTASNAAAQPIPDPAVHAAAQRLSDAQASIYEQRALDLVLDSPVLLSSEEGRPLPPQGEGWSIQHPTSGQVMAEDLAKELHRAHEIAQYDATAGDGAFYTGLVILGGSLIPGTSTGILAATNNHDATAVAGAITGVTAAVGLITMGIAYCVNLAAEREIPLDVGQRLVTEYNAKLAKQLGDLPRPAEPTALVATASAAPALVVAPAPVAAPPASTVTPIPVTPAPLAAAPAPAVAPVRSSEPAVQLGVQLLDRKGVQVVRVIHPRCSQLRPGDVILSIDEIPTPSLKVVKRYMSMVRAGDALTLRVRRGGKRVDVSIRV